MAKTWFKSRDGNYMYGYGFRNCRLDAFFMVMTNLNVFGMRFSQASLMQ